MSSITEHPAATVSRTIQLTVNGQPVTTSLGMLDQFLTEAGYAGAHVATALNGEFIPQRARTTTALADGDRVEILSPRQGG
jgi:sulfur carrier protein